MTRVAVVTGGTRGIGAAISAELKRKGCRVAANYGGNDEAAQNFQVKTGIPVFKFDVSDYDACEAGIARITKDLGPVATWNGRRPWPEKGDTRAATSFT